MAELKKGTKLDMTWEEITEYLNGDPEPVAVATYRKDGFPNIVPLGHVFDGTYIYFSVGIDRGMQKRIARDPRMCVARFNSQVWPPKFVIAHGTAEIVEDPDNRISRQICKRFMGTVEGVDFERYYSNWVGQGRTVIRMKIERPETGTGKTLAWDAGHSKGFVY